MSRHCGRWVRLQRSFHKGRTIIFFESGGGATGNFRKNIPAQKMMPCGREPLEKNVGQVLFTSIIMIFDGKSYCPLNRIMPNKRREKYFMPQKITQTPSPLDPQKYNGPSLKPLCTTKMTTATGGNRGKKAREH